MEARRRQSPARRPRFHYAWIMAALGHLNVLSALGLARFGYTMILPSMKEALRFTYAETGWLATGNFIGYMIGSPLAGLLASRWPLRRLILIALLGLAAGLAATRTARSSQACRHPSGPKYWRAAGMRNPLRTRPMPDPPV